MKNGLLVFLSLFSSVFVQSSDIFRAIALNDKVTIQKWLKSGSDIDQLNEQGQTPLMIAVQTGSKKWVKKLLRHNALVNIVDNVGKTALDYAVESQNKNVTLELTKYNAKVTSKNNLEKAREIIKRKVKKMKIVTGVFGGLAACCLVVVSVTACTMLSNFWAHFPVDYVIIAAGAGTSMGYWSKKDKEYTLGQSSMILETKKKQ